MPHTPDLTDRKDINRDESNFVIKLEGLKDKFNSFKDRINSDRAVLEQDITKFIVQVQFHQQKDGKEQEDMLKYIDLNYFRQ